MSIIAVANAIIVFYTYVILAYILMSWFRPSGALFDIYRVLGSIAEPYLSLFRRFVPVTGGMDFSPMIALIVLQYVIRPVVFAILAGVSV